jgi:signal transduction histidine kinase/ActR/RegA family two-component response regulator
MPGIPLRRRLFILTAAGILPLAFITGVGLYLLAREQRAQAQRAGVELARSVGTAVDAELRSSVAVVQTLATSLTLDRGDLVGFRDRALRTLRLQPDWAGIVLADRSGAAVVDTRSERGAGLSAFDDRESLDRVIRTRQPVVGNLARDPQSGWHFAVRVPVVRAGELRYTVTALVTPEKIRGIVTRQRVPGDWVISIVDASGRRVARSRAHEENLGGRLSESVAAVVSKGGVEGTGEAYTLEGQPIFAPYSRVGATGWNAVLGIPTGLVDASVRRSLVVYGGAVLLSLLLGTAAALWAARSINRPIAELRRAAQALGRGEMLPPPAGSIQEIDEVAAALAAASEQLAQGEAEREHLLRKERLAREAAEAADRTKDEFMAVVSHELRTPLNAVYGWARILQSGKLTDEARIARATDAIVRNADVQVQLIDDLLDLSRITSGKMRLDVLPVELPVVLQAAVDAVRPAAGAKGMQIDTVVDPNVRPMNGDPGRLQQVVWNLLMNAVKFSPDGARVELRLQRVDAHVEIVVSDTGKGIAPEMLPHVFERFRQADSSSTRAHGGLGLGLALVKHLVELHGGTVAAHSDGPGRGATFTVKLPFSLAAPVAALAMRRAGSAPSAGAPSGTVRLDGVRVLVVDNDAEAVALADAVLAAAGAEVKTCLGAAEGFDLLCRWRPDVLLSDIEMPGEDGYSLIHRVRSLAADQGGATPAIALTAYARPRDRERSLRAGFSVHLPKPVDPAELTAVVAGVAAARRA